MNKDKRGYKGWWGYDGYLFHHCTKEGRLGVLDRLRDVPYCLACGNRLSREDWEKLKIMLLLAGKDVPT